MFRKRRGMGLSKFLGIIIFGIGFVVFLYMIPFALWIFIFAFICMLIGIWIYNF